MVAFNSHPSHCFASQAQLNAHVRSPLFIPSSLFFPSFSLFSTCFVSACVSVCLSVYPDPGRGRSGEAEGAGEPCRPVRLASTCAQVHFELVLRLRHAQRRAMVQYGDGRHRVPDRRKHHHPVSDCSLLLFTHTHTHTHPCGHCACNLTHGPNSTAGLTLVVPCMFVCVCECVFVCMQSP